MVRSRRQWGAITTLFQLVLLVAVAAVLVRQAKTAAYEPRGPWYFMCRNPECKLEVKVENFKDLQKYMPVIGENDPIEKIYAVCPKCGKESLIRAVACPRCKKTFVPESYYNMVADNDRCPTCKVWSPGEQELVNYWNKNPEKRREFFAKHPDKAEYFRKTYPDLKSD